MTLPDEFAIDTSAFRDCGPVMVPAEFARDTSISLAAKGLMVYLDHESRFGDLNYEEVSRGLGMTREELMPLVDQLVRCGYLAKD